MERDGGDVKEVKEALREEREMAEAKRSGIENEKQHKALLNNQLRLEERVKRGKGVLRNSRWGFGEIGVDLNMEM